LKYNGPRYLNKANSREWRSIDRAAIFTSHFNNLFCYDGFFFTDYWHIRSKAFSPSARDIAACFSKLAANLDEIKELCKKAEECFAKKIRQKEYRVFVGEYGRHLMSGGRETNLFIVIKRDGTATVENKRYTRIYDASVPTPQLTDVEINANVGGGELLLREWRQRRAQLLAEHEQEWCKKTFEFGIKERPPFNAVDSYNRPFENLAGFEAGDVVKVPFVGHNEKYGEFSYSLYAIVQKVTRKKIICLGVTRAALAVLGHEYLEEE